MTRQVRKQSAMGSSRELAPSEIQFADSTDYLLGGALTLKNGRIDKYQFDEGYCQAAGVGNTCQDNFTFYYYNRDHLGNIRQVAKATRSKNGTIVQTMDYYLFGAQLCDGSADSNVQSRRYNGKELDQMQGLDTYDYGARQYNPVLARWDRVDPLCEKYYSISPYAYCHNNPVNAVDLEGLEPIYNTAGLFLGNTKEGFTGQIYIYKGFGDIDFSKQTIQDWLKSDEACYLMTYEDVATSYTGKALENFVSNVMTDIVAHFDGIDINGTCFDINTLYNKKIEYEKADESNFNETHKEGKISIKANRPTPADYEATVENLASSLIVHEWYGHGVRRYGSNHKIFGFLPYPNHHKVYEMVKGYKRFYEKNNSKI